MPSATTAQQIRIAIALVALRHKPPEQSVQAYILDLQTAFPLPCSAVLGSQSHSEPLASPNPWRERVLILEKDLQELQEQYDKEKIELLALRKAAQPSKQRRKGPRNDHDGSDPIPDPDVSVKGRKRGKAKKAALPQQTIQTVPLPQPPSRLGLNAILSGPLTDIPTSSKIASGLDAFDSIADMLDLDMFSVPLDLLQSTTTRALRAIGTALELTVSRYSLKQNSSFGNPLAGPAAGGTSGWAAGLRDPGLTLDTIDVFLRRLILTAFPALLAHHRFSSATSKSKAKPVEANGKGKSKGRDQQDSARAHTSHTRASGHCLEAVASAVDDVLGKLYALILVALVRSFAVLSEGFVYACLGAHPGAAAAAGVSLNAGTGPNSSGSASSSDTGPVDLRPIVFALLDSTLTALESVLPESAYGFSDSPPGLPTEGKSESIPGTDHIKTLLALECVRELGKLYAVPLSLSSRSSPSSRVSAPAPAAVNRADTGAPVGGSSETSTRAHMRKPRTGNDAHTGDGDDPGGSAPYAHPRTHHDTGTEADSRGRAAHAALRGFHGYRSASASTSTSALAVDAARGGSSSSGSGALCDECTRPGTFSVGPLASSSAEEGERGRGGCAEGNFGEIELGRGGRGPVLARDAELGTERIRRETATGAGVDVESHARAQEREGAVSDSDGHGGRDGLRAGERARLRMTRLARKDAVWYLCAVMHRLLPRPGQECGADSGSGSASSSSILGSATGAISGSHSSASASGQPPPFSVPNTQPDAAPGPGPTSASVNVNVNVNASEWGIGRAAEQAVYDALADLLLRTRSCPNSSPLSFALSTSTDLSSSLDVVPPSVSVSPSPPPASSVQDLPPSRACRFRSSASTSGLASSPVSNHGLLDAFGPARARAMARDRTARGTETTMAMEIAIAAEAEEDGTRSDDMGLARGLRGNVVGESPQAGTCEAMGEVERQMVLAVLERAWLGV